MDWTWRNFGRHEIACYGTTCGCDNEIWDYDKYGGFIPDYFIRSMDALQSLRDDWGQPISLNSAHRCIKHNKAEKGAKNSKHLDIAFDCRIPKHKQVEFIHLAKRHGFNGIGVYDNFVHIDIRDNPAEWTG